MELVYFFCVSAVIRVPLFSYDRRLFGLLAAKGGCVWDNSRQEFSFKLNRNTVACDCLRRAEGPETNTLPKQQPVLQGVVVDCNLPGIPCVKVDETAAVPVGVFKICSFDHTLT